MLSEMLNIFLVGWIKTYPITTGLRISIFGILEPTGEHFGGMSLGNSTDTVQRFEWTTTRPGQKSEYL
jgi:hypothetical protein